MKFVPTYLNCYEPSCAMFKDVHISMFGTLSDKLLHETQNEHQFENDECLKNPKDKITVHFINTLLDSNGRKGIFENPCHTQPSTYNISSGWALKKSAPRKSIPADVKVKGTTSISSKLKSKRLQLFFIFYMKVFFTPTLLKNLYTQLGILVLLIIS